MPVLKIKLFWVPVFLCLGWITLVFWIFFILKESTQVKVSSAIEAQIKLNVINDGYDQITRYFWMLEKLELISCANVSIQDGDQLPRILIRKTEHSCASPWWKIFDSKTSISTTTNDKRIWHATYSVTEGSVSYFYLYAIILLGLFSIVGTVLFRAQILEEKRRTLKRAEEIREKYYIAARKYAHDIRSPLSVFNMVAFSLKRSDVEKFDLMSSALKKVTGLTEGFLKGIKNIKHEEGERIEIKTLFELVNEEIEQKFAEYQSIKNRQIQISFKTNQMDAEANILAPSTIFLSSAISNILNNAIESIMEMGTIEIEALSTQKEVVLRFIDSGCGIPLSIAERLGKEVVTTKKSGNGIGLLEIVQGLKNLEGRLEFESNSNKKGSAVSIYFKRSWPDR